MNVENSKILKIYESLYQIRQFLNVAYLLHV